MKKSHYRRSVWVAGLLAVAIIGMGLYPAAGGEALGSMSKAVVAVEEGNFFREREWQVDLFGLGDFYRGAEGNFAGSLSGTGGTSRQFSGRPGWGLGLGVSYFFTRYVGVGFEQDVFGRDAGSFRSGDYGYIRWASIGNFLVRYPIERWRVAPYLMVGGGALYGNTPDTTLSLASGRQVRYRMSGQGFGHVGGGVDFRLTRNAGVFSDLRYLFSGVDGLPESQMLWRFGVRLAF